MVRIEIAIDDQQWPKLKMVINRTDVDGQRVALTNSRQYDQAYNQFENDVHNHLRPAVDQLIKRRMTNQK